MDRVDVLLRGDCTPAGVVLAEVWWDYYVNGDRVERLQLRKEFADVRWKTWQDVLFETTSRAQLSLF